MEILIILAVIIAFLGFITLTGVSMGVGLIGIACLLAIFARIAQASQHK